MTSPRLAAEAVAVLEGAGARLHYMDPFPRAEAVADLARKVGAVAILSRQGPVTAAVMDAAPGLRIVARHGVGVDDVDVAEAQRRGIVVTRAPGSNTQAVAEHTMAMILALAKRLPALSAQVAAGEWRLAADKVRDLAGLRLGLLGFGAIAQAVVPLAQAFGMDLAVFTPSGRAGAVVAMPNLPALLARSDVLSLHLPYNPSTRHLIGPAELAALPRGAFVINTSRGGLVDEAALLDALESGQVAGAGLDVFEDEPPGPAHPLRRHPAVIATPHVA
ncbi:MAG: NAD(P)-dependent oxidoreductase, partial [Acetobacteraceae bacterium]|nr:NAD(P)-dependent oxidoreductase [Acetobacteraceae bacterium]